MNNTSVSASSMILLLENIGWAYDESQVLRFLEECPKCKDSILTSMLDVVYERILIAHKRGDKRLVSKIAEDAYRSISRGDFNLIDTFNPMTLF